MSAPNANANAIVDPGPGAPKTARGARTRARILKAAESTFGTLGYHRAGISDITRDAGVAQGTFYNYFAGKEEILRELEDVRQRSMFRVHSR